jgi:DNA segregation ATPase FtsK/SpoIIIE-like protein
MKELAQRLILGFEEFGAPINLEGNPHVGPSFYRFLARPAENVKADKILNMGTTIWPRLKTDQPPQISMERGLVTVDVERSDREVLRWSHDIIQKSDAPSRGTCRFPIGIAVEGTWTYADLSETEHSHFLVAGTNGSGKSEWLKMVVGSLCAANTPKTLSLVLIDPKRTAFFMLSSSPFLLLPIVIPAERDVLAVLDQLIREMDKRYSLFQKAQVTDLKVYNNPPRDILPRIICICDEYADLVLSDAKKGKEVERRIGRIGAMGRAAGVHLILATQRPSKDIVKGVIKANMNARVALKVNARIDSHIVIEQSGAETLLGNGDLLFKDLGKAIRLQAPLISDTDLKQAARC